MQGQSFYEVLGVKQSSTHDEIKKAYRSLSLQFHPDKNNNDATKTNKFKDINEAYETLGDDNTRAEYDMKHSNTFSNMFQNQNQGQPNMEDMMNTFFGNNFSVFTGMNGSINIGPRSANFTQTLQKPVPIITNIILKIEDVYSGSIVPLEVERWIIQNNSKVFEKETIYLTVPKGIDNNEMIILREKGNIINESLKGDIKIFVKIENKTNFQRQGLDLILETTVSLKNALCGFNTEIFHLNGKIYTLNNLNGNLIKPGYKKIIPNLGLTRETTTGNLIIIFNIDFPDKLNDDQIEKLKLIL